MSNYTYSQDFLDALDKMNIRVQYAKILLLTFDEKPLQEIQGRITGGSISINGASAVRRTINLTMSADKSIGKITDLENLISLNKKFKVEVGLDTPIQYIAKRGETITWFKQGTYVISSATISESINGYTISINGNDKMVMLNGIAGGTIPFTTVLSEKDEYDDFGNVITTDVNLFQIIQEIVTHFGKEPADNIIINDIIDIGKIYVKYNGNDTYYMYLNKDGIPITGSVGTPEYNPDILWPDDEGGAKNYQVKKYQNGQLVGYFETDLTWPDSNNNPLQASSGETVTSILDKIKNALGNYEYFYDLDGRFVFQQIQNWVNTTSKEVNLHSFDYTDYFRDYSKMPTQHKLSDKTSIISISQNPKYDNIKNDFVVIGKQTYGDGLEKPIMYHVAIDKKPIINNQKIGWVQMDRKEYESKNPTAHTEEDWNLIDDTYHARWVCYSEDSLDWYDYQGNYFGQIDEDNIRFKEESDPEVKKIELGDGKTREITTKLEYTNNYQTRVTTITSTLITAAADDGAEGTSTNESIKKVIDTFNSEFLIESLTQDDWREVLYQRALIENAKGSNSTDYDEELLGFWRSVYDPSKTEWDKNGHYCTNLLNLDEGSVPDYTNLVYWLDLLEPGAPLAQYSVSAIGRRTKAETDDKIKTILNQLPEDVVYCFNTAEAQQSKNNNVFLLKQLWQPMFVEASIGESCYDRVRTLIYNHFTYNTALSLTMIPRYYLEPNVLMELDLEDIKGKFQITQISIPLNYNGTMNLSLTETNQRG